MLLQLQQHVITIHDRYQIHDKCNYNSRQVLQFTTLGTYAVTTGVSDDGVHDRKELGRQPRSVDCQVTLCNNGFQDGVPYFWREIQNTILALELSLFIGLLRFICQIVHFKTWINNQ